MPYLNFDLTICRLPASAESPGRYRVRLLRSALMNEIHRDFDSPVDDATWSDLQCAWKFGLGRQTEARSGSRTTVHAKDAAHAFGKSLYDNVLGPELGLALGQFLHESHIDDDCEGVRIRLSLETRDLHKYPWELLVYGPSDMALSPSTETPVVRYISSEIKVENPHAKLPLRVLAIVANVGADIQGIARLNVTKEMDYLEQAFARFKRTEVELDFVTDGTLEGLRNHRARNPKRYHVVHFIGHGDVGDDGNGGLLFLNDDRTDVTLVDAAEFVSCIGSAQLVVLNSCFGAAEMLQSDTDDNPAFSGFAQRLARAGIPAVVGMQTRISDDAAVTFARAFYASLAFSAPVDVCMANARQAIRHQPNPLEWATPVLFMRSDDGHVLTFSNRPSFSSDLLDKPAEPPEKRFVEVWKITWSPLATRGRRLFASVLAIVVLSVAIATLFGRFSSGPPSIPTCGDTTLPPALPTLKHPNRWIALGVRTADDAELRPQTDALRRGELENDESSLIVPCVPGEPQVVTLAEGAWTYDLQNGEMDAFEQLPAHTAVTLINAAVARPLRGGYWAPRYYAIYVPFVRGQTKSPGAK